MSVDSSGTWSDLGHLNSEPHQNLLYFTENFLYFTKKANLS